jgi:transcriptional regulator with XRE-family HTH domain
MSSAAKFMDDLNGPMTVGKLIRAYRTRLDLTLAQLGGIIGQSVSYVSDLERDKKSISLAQVKDIAERMKESVEHYASVWIRQELHEAKINFEVELKPIDGKSSIFSHVRNETIKHRQKAAVVKSHGSIKKSTRKKAS